MCVIIQTFSKNIISLELSSQSSIVDFMCHNIAIINSSSEKINVKKIEFEIYSANYVIQKKLLPAELLASHLEVVENRLKDLNYCEGLFYCNKLFQSYTIHQSALLKSHSGFILGPQYFSVDQEASRLKIKVYWNKQGKNKVFETNLDMDITSYKQKNPYKLPLLGPSLVTGSPDIFSHHRRAFHQEFAIDFVNIGDGLRLYKKSPNNIKNYYSYKNSVLSAESGKVVHVCNNFPDSPIMRLDHFTNKSDEFQTFIEKQKAVIRKHGVPGTLGNCIVVEHKEKEYSLYAHLRPNSICVKKNQIVDQGQKVAEVGNSGNSTVPHLHFQLMDSEDLDCCRSLPVTFSDSDKLVPTSTYIHFGDILN